MLMIICNLKREEGEDFQGLKRERVPSALDVRVTHVPGNVQGCIVSRFEFWETHLTPYMSRAIAIIPWQPTCGLEMKNDQEDVAGDIVSSSEYVHIAKI